jgi:hypothetical protein
MLSGANTVSDKDINMPSPNSTLHSDIYLDHRPKSRHRCTTNVVVPSFQPMKDGLIVFICPERNLLALEDGHT